MPRRPFLSLAALVLLAPAALSQSPTDFSGRWTRVVDSSAAPGGGRGGMAGFGQEAFATQDAKTLTVKRNTQAGEIVSVYNLDGSESKNTLSMGGNSIDTFSKAKWDGAKLVITTTASFGGASIETSMVLALESPNTLVIQSTAPGRGGGAPTTTTTTFKKG